MLTDVQLKPLKLIPAYKDYIWGGEKLRRKFGKDTDITPLAESWELSCHKDGLSRIVGEDKTLDEFIKENPDCLGTHCPGGELPILIKLIDAKSDLSVQVHPNDEQARAWENQNGKTEMWYVVEADEGAKMTCGVKDDITKEELEAAIGENRVEALLNTCPSKKGDVFFVEAGTIHAIGGGNVIAEIQQNSNVTYRLYDYGRIGKDGKTRELHVEKGVKASNCKKTEPRKIPECSDGARLLGSCRYFMVKEIKLTGEMSFYADEKSYHVIVVTEGEVKMKCEQYCDVVNAGQTVFIPAGVGEYNLIGDATILLVSNQPDYHIEINIDDVGISSVVVDEYGVNYGRKTNAINKQGSDEEITANVVECAKEACVESGIEFDDIDSMKIRECDISLSCLEDLTDKKICLVK